VTAHPQIEIRRLTADLLDDVVAIHMAGMGYSLNAQLGPDHLRYLYTRMANDPTCYVGVAVADSRPAGVLSGSVDATKFSSRLMRTMPIGRLARTAIHFALRPKLIGLWLRGNAIAQPVRIENAEIVAVLTTIVVSERAQGRGLGRALVAAFEDFLLGEAIFRYRLDTKIENEAAAKFYRSLGFIEVARRADSIVLTKELRA
jgi:ribosomal protein S18 acetylase RimI-like enzyme